MSAPAPAPAPARRGRPRALLLAAVVLLLLPVVMGVVVRDDLVRPPFQGVDDTWLRWMGGPHEGLPEAAAAVLNWFGGPYGALVQLAAVLLLLVVRRWRSALFLLAAAVGSQLAIQGMKHIVDRPRPANPLVTVDHGSFPSGHVATTAMAVVVIGALFVPAAARRRWWPAGVLLVLAMMWSRTWLHAHWLSDTAAGALAGAGATLLITWVFAPLLAKERGRPLTQEPAVPAVVAA